MFLEKLRKLSWDLQVPTKRLNVVTKQALLYGMRLNREPGALKRALRQVGAESSNAKDTWGGNAYLLITMPKVFADRKEKIPCLEDYLYMKKNLSKQHVRMLKKRVQNIPNLSTEEILRTLIPAIRLQTYKGRFLHRVDSMYGGSKDVEQDITSLAMEIINKEYMNFRTHNIEDISKYVSFCLGTKSKTYVGSSAPKAFTVALDDNIKSDTTMIEFGEEKLQEAADIFDKSNFTNDLDKFLPKNHKNAVLLFLQMGEPELEGSFNAFLQSKKKERSDLNQKELGEQICNYTGVDVFTTLRNNKQFYQYLKA